MSKQSFEDDLRQVILDMLEPLLDGRGLPSEGAAMMHIDAATGKIKQLIRERLPEKKVTEADKLRAQGHRVVGSSPFVDAENVEYNAALDDVEKGLGL